MRHWWFIPLLLGTVAYGQIEGKFTLPKTVFTSGEPVWLSFEMENSGPDTLYFIAGDPYTFCGGYRLELTEGGPLKHSSCNNGVGGSCLLGTHTLLNGGHEQDKILLNYDHDLTRPGRYHLKATRYLRTATTNDMAAMVDGNHREIEQEFEIEITPRDDAALQAELSPYVEQLKSPKEDKVREAARVLSSSAPPFLESTMLAMLDRPATRTFAIAGLEKINTPAARDALAKIARALLEKYSYEAELATRLKRDGRQELFPATEGNRRF
jgi:hypothetical protein